MVHHTPHRSHWRLCTKHVTCSFAPIRTFCSCLGRATAFVVQRLHYPPARGALRCCFFSWWFVGFSIWRRSICSRAHRGDHMLASAHVCSCAFVFLRVGFLHGHPHSQPTCMHHCFHAFFKCGRRPYGTCVATHALLPFQQGFVAWFVPVAV